MCGVLGICSITIECMSNVCVRLKEILLFRIILPMFEQFYGSVRLVQSCLACLHFWSRMAGQVTSSCECC